MWTQPAQTNRWLFVFCSLMFIALAMSGAVADEKSSPAPAGGMYRLRAGDEVAVSVLPRKEYDCGGVILPDGMLYLKNVGGIRAAGITIPELAEQVRKALDQKLVNPRVTATVVRTAPVEERPAGGTGTGMDPKLPSRPVTFSKITVVGAVRRTGPVDLEPGLRVRKALDLAGGTDPAADLTQVVILRKDLSRKIVDLSDPDAVQDPEKNILIEEGDSIEVRQLPIPPPIRTVGTARITGQVLNPGLVELKPGMGLEDLIVAAGKLTPLADVEHIRFQREGKPEQIVNLVQQQEKGLGGTILLMPGDEVFVPEQKDVVVLIGAVPKPGPKALRPGSTVRDFFLGGGEDVAAALNPAFANLGGAQLIRRGQEARKIDLEDVLVKAKDKQNVALEPGDVIFLPPKRGPKKGPLEYIGQLGPLGFLFGLF